MLNTRKRVCVVCVCCQRYAVVWCGDVCSLWCTMCAQWGVCIDLHVSLFFIDASGKIVVRTVMYVFVNFFETFFEMWEVEDKVGVHH